MRERTTWNRSEIQKQASAMSKRAEDPRAMNQDHLQRQPSADKYLTGDPSTFAEDVHPSGQNWKAEYSDGETARDEIGLPEMRGDTFSHPETDPGSSSARGGGGGARQASLDEETLVKKADLCCKVARQMLGSKAVEAAVEDQALALMNLSDPDLIATVNRLAQDQEDQGQAQDQGEKQAQDQQAQDQDQGQGEKQAKELPPEFLEQIQKKKDEAKDKKDDKEASAKLGTLEQIAQQVQQMAQQLQQMMQGQQQEQVQQVQQVPMEQQGQGQQVQQGQTMAEHQQQALDAMLQEQSNDQMIDQMLAQGQQPQVQGLDANDFGIQMDSPSMDIGEVPMGPEDEVLSTLFANNAEVQNAQQAHILQHGAPAPMQVQATTPQTRTASTRTIGTRPTAGVSQLGGSPTPSAGGDVEKLSNLWNSAPDVSDVFRS